MKTFHNTYHFWCLFFISLHLTFTLFGQATNDPKEDFLYGEYYLEQYRHPEALVFYLSALRFNPENCNINYRIGLCYMNIIGKQQNALSYLEKSVKEINENYIAWKYKNTGAPKEAWLLLGDAYHRENKLLDASYAYNKYKELIDKSEKEKSKIIQDRIIALGISTEQQRERQNVSFVNLGQIINSRFSDYNPVLSGNQDILIYTQFWESYDRIMMTYRNVEGWTDPIEINQQLGSEGDCYTASISYDGRELYLIKTGDNNSDIYVSYRRDSVWSKMEALEKINSRYHESSVCISSDGYYLYFASNRPGGEGKFDIYRANKVGNSWQNITNIGNVINTKGNEEAPYITQDGATLYFSSDGHESVGNMDIMYSELIETRGWELPVNLGMPVNTTGDDVYYTFFKESNTGYLSRDKAEGYGRNDIYMVKTAEDLRHADNEFFMPLKGEDIQLSMNDKKELNSLRSATKEIDLATDTTNHFFDPDTSNTYTIQIMALEYPVSINTISLSPLIVSPGNDGLHRYTYGEFAIYSEALLILYEIRESGFADAFIRKVETIQNYSGRLKH